MPDVVELNRAYQGALENYRTSREALRLADALLANAEEQLQASWIALCRTHEPGACDPAPWRVRETYQPKHHPNTIRKGLEEAGSPR